MIPYVSEMFCFGPYSGAYVRVLLGLMDDEFDPLTPSLLSPWCRLRADGEIDPEELKVLCKSWHQGELAPKTQDAWCLQVVPHKDDPFEGPKPRVFSLMAHLPFEARWRPHPAIHQLGAIHLYGGWRCELDPDANLYGPVVFGSECTVRAGARVACCIFGHRVRVGSSHLSRCVIGDDTSIASNVTAGDAIIGAKCTIGAGVVLHSRNKKYGHGGKEIVITDYTDCDRREIRTGRTVLGPIIGDHCQVYDDLQPGTILLPGCHVRKGMNLPAGIYSAQYLDALAAVRAIPAYFKARAAHLVERFTHHFGKMP